MQNTNHIQSIQVPNFLSSENGNLNWQTNADVNILAGPNGLGKTTLLKALFEKNKSSKKIDYLNLQEMPALDKVELDYSKNFLKLQNTLDFHLRLVQEKYYQYVKIINEQKRLLQCSEMSDVDKTYWEQTLTRSQGICFDILDELFITKKIDRDNHNCICFVENLDFYKGCNTLSAGQKSILIILLTVLIQDNQPYTLIIDNPEANLHCDWQANLIDYIRKINKNCQIIMATHAPSIIINGWRDKVFEITDLYTKHN